MTLRPCKAAIDCVGFIYTIDRVIDLIIAEQITDPDAIDEFNDLKEKMQKRLDKWIEDHVDFDAN